MNAKRKVMWGTVAALAILFAFFFSRSREELTLKYRPTIYERVDQSFTVVDLKFTRQSELNFVCGGNLGCWIKLYTDRVLSAIGVRKPSYQIGGTSDFLWITYQSKKLNETSCADPWFSDERDKPVFPRTSNSVFDSKSGIGLLAVAIPNSMTNFAGWQLHLNIPPDGKRFLGGKYAVFKFQPMD